MYSIYDMYYNAFESRYTTNLDDLVGNVNMTYMYILVL